MTLLLKTFAIALVIGIIAGVYWLIWIIYTHFANRFGWPHLTYLEAVLACIALSTLGGWIFKSKA